MPTECSAERFDFGLVGRREVVGSFDGGAITSDAGALLLGTTDRAIGLVDRLAGCFTDYRKPELIEHRVATLVGQRVFGIALGYEDLNDHDELRRDPVMAVLAGKLEAGRANCAPVAGKSTLNRLELSRETATRYHKIAADPNAIESLFDERHLKPNVSMELDSSELLKRFVAADVGIGFIARSNVIEDVKAGALAAIPIADAAIRRELALVFRKDKALSRAALAFIEIAVKLKPAQAL